MMFERDPESLGDAFGSNVVMGRADTAGRKEISVPRPQRVHRGNDLRLLIGNDPHFSQIDADAGQKFGDVADVFILGAARQNFVADHQHRGGDHHRCRRFWPRSSAMLSVMP